MIKITILISILFAINTNASAENFQENDVYSAFQKAMNDGNISRREADRIIFIASNPYAPVGSHSGNKFLEALSWYNDITNGNKNGRFTLRELESSFQDQLQKYLDTLSHQATKTQRMSAWKMLQKLKILEKTIISSGKGYFPYRSKELSQISYKNEWNKKNTIKSFTDFNKRVIRSSWNRPVLVKFGLTYCVHCLLMENLGSVPAVARKYTGKVDVYKLWWNPNEPNQYFEMNTIASEQGISSSPMFNLYIDGRLVKSEYAFPDENGEGMEEYFHGYISHP